MYKIFLLSISIEIVSSFGNGIQIKSRTRYFKFFICETQNQLNFLDSFMAFCAWYCFDTFFELLLNNVFVGCVMSIAECSGSSQLLTSPLLRQSKPIHQLVLCGLIVQAVVDNRDWFWTFPHHYFIYVVKSAFFSFPTPNQSAFPLAFSPAHTFTVSLSCWDPAGLFDSAQIFCIN